MVAANPATEAPGFDVHVEMLQALRPELDVAWTTQAGPSIPAVETPNLSPRVMPHEQQQQEVAA